MKALILSIPILCCWFHTDFAYATACPKGFVSTGLSTSEVHAKCGDPTYLDEWIKEHTIQTQDGFFHQHQEYFEEWTYDFGPTRLVQILRFKDGRLIHIKSGSYGGKTEERPKSRIPIIALGNSKAQVVSKWGRPNDVAKRTEMRRFYGARGVLIQQSVQIEEWTYDFGPHRLIRIVSFEDGKLVSNKSRGYGTKKINPD